MSPKKPREVPMHTRSLILAGLILPAVASSQCDVNTLGFARYTECVRDERRLELERIVAEARPNPTAAGSVRLERAEDKDIGLREWLEKTGNDILVERRIRDLLRTGSFIGTGKSSDSYVEEAIACPSASVHIFVTFPNTVEEITDYTYRHCAEKFVTACAVYAQRVAPFQIDDEVAEFNRCGRELFPISVAQDAVEEYLQRLRLPDGNP
jgi:hypothetical protein